jgi:hypothetical protein
MLFLIKLASLGCSRPNITISKFNGISIYVISISAEQKWENILNKYDIEWKNIHIHCTKHTKNTKLGWFQCRIIRPNITISKFNGISIYVISKIHLFNSCHKSETL